MSNPDDNDHDLISTREAARIAHVSPETIIRWLLHDGLQGVRRRAGKGWRYLVSRKSLLGRMELMGGPSPAPPVRRSVGMDPWTREKLREFGLLEAAEPAG
jgi:hypothetical protein